MHKPSPSTPARPSPNAFILVNGRRWRKSDPSIHENFHQELVNELMAARRAVRAATSDREIRRSRRRVNDAKIALGERGRAWWLPLIPVARSQRIEAALMTLLRSRHPGRSICPSDIARIVGGKAWRTLLPLVRDRAVKFSEQGQLEILRGGRVVKTKLTEGVLRYRLKPTL
jgi:hypothetical protein